MTGRRDPTSTYDRMMAEVQMDSDEEVDSKKQPSSRMSESKHSSRSTASKNESTRDDQSKKSTKTREMDAKQSDDQAQPSDSSQPKRRSSSFPPSQRPQTHRGSKSRNSDGEDQSDSDHEQEAPVRHREADPEFTTPVAPVSAPTCQQSECESIRALLTRAPRHGSPPIRCYVERDRHGLHMLHPVYRLFLEDTKQFLLCAQKRSTSKTSNYLLTMEKNPTDRRSPLIVGKLRANWSGSEYIVYNDGISPDRTALESNVREIFGFIEFAYDEMGPGRMNVRVPAVQENGLASKWKDPDLDKDSPARQSFLTHVDKTALLVRNKRPQFDATTGGHVLDFKGRVTMPSIKNFQMQSDVHGDDTVLQFGRVSCQPPGPRAQCKCHKHTFVMDVQHPLNLVQAFAICLATLDTKVADAKMYESVAKLVKKKSRSS
ncbi:hypothetical protein Poli38472_013055 [Pythium oligandrum]|uniref:Tubby C-terminal domain-containing protein n=1 Tax=Pythium oligandrum TaxID=41045 RepID=A0A8K1CLA7_PYTOL|nr:hypothetical protein Poli38472_013055 [Pythium oligandrum]|eukprot:TMW64433.1 hypothetical protein Poli38472_013055 [Pythium oligandrum]